MLGDETGLPVGIKSAVGEDAFWTQLANRMATTDRGAPDTAAVEVNYEEEQWPAERLLGKLWHCTDIMPRTLCGDLELERGSTYAQAAQHLRSIRSVGYRFER
jgi:hypothetical protein